MPSSNDDKPKVLRGTKSPGATRFHRLAMREGGIGRDDAIKKVQKFIQELKPKYIEWLGKDMERLESIVEGLRIGTPGHVEWQQTYRQACVIRDLGSTFGYHAVTEVADSLCELVKRLETNGVHHQQAIETHMRALQLVGAAETDALSASVDQRLIEGLRSVVDMFPKEGAGKP